MEVAVLGASLSVLSGALLNALKESIQLQRARGLDLKRAASGDTHQVPELKLNFCMISELFVQILATGFGVLALVWATAVLLGGFSNLIPRKDFWVITAIVFIQAARVVGLNVSPQAEFFNQVPLAFLVLGSSFEGWVVIIMAFLAKLVLAIKLVAGAVCISLSIYRLVALSIHHDNTFAFHALILLYALVLLQGGLFIIWLILRLYRSYLANRVSLKYGLKDKRELIDKYMDKTMSTAIKDGLSSTISRNLASFAVDLMKSDYSYDHNDAVLMIHTLTSQEKHRTRTPSQEDHTTRTLSQILSSPLCVSRLLDMVTSKSRIDQRTKICIAEIVAHLANNLRLADISGATESISSMIDPYFPKISTPATDVNIDHQAAIDIPNDQQGSKPLIIHGLLILAKLAVNPDNCKQIYDSKGLFSKIISPVKTKVYEILGDDGIAITEKALEVLSMLVSGTDETNGKIRRDICSNGIAVNDIRPILQSIYNKLKVPAAKILTELYLDVSTRATIGLDNIAVFIEILMNIFFDAGNESGLRETAGTALARLAMDNANCITIINFPAGRGTAVQLLTDMIPRANDRLYRTAIAQLLMQLCANSDPDAEMPRLAPVKTILPEVLEVICNVEHSKRKSGGFTTAQPGPATSRKRKSGCNNLQAVTQLEGGRRNSLAAFLGLGLQICEKLNITEDEFHTALVSISLSMELFVEKLNAIIEQCKGHYSIDSLEGKADYLIIIKTVAKLCTWMMQYKPDSITVFRNKDTSTKLRGALEDMRELELGMVLSGSAGDIANNQNLSTIVTDARQMIMTDAWQMMDANQHQTPDPQGVASNLAAPGVW